MQSPLGFVILALFLFTLSSGGCVGAGNKNANSRPTPAAANNPDANAAKTNVEELGMLVNIPFEAEDIVWKPFPAQKKLIAVLRFSPADSAKLVAEAEKDRPAESVTLQSETWFPEELIAQSEISGEDMLRGSSYSANAFLQEPYTEGRITRIEGTDYFVLEASSK